ncbi:unnamed protein product [Pleuronectes platessa]|uniref:Uncharacterized protein n=1 Tax=Pleuronectes platessa TaxID=8262 RepID=A0A9N7Y741_PLEPL|nr:unnamed protein product [Pleuronectes platessa]
MHERDQERQTVRSAAQWEVQLQQGGGADLKNIKSLTISAFNNEGTKPRTTRIKKVLFLQESQTKSAIEELLGVTQQYFKPRAFVL